MKVISRTRALKGFASESPETLRARLEAFALKTRDESIRHKSLVDSGLVVLETRDGTLAGLSQPAMDAGTVRRKPRKK